MMNTNFYKTIIISLALAIGSPAFAKGDAAAGKEKAATCAGCHGAEGISPSPQWPNLAGQVPGYIASQLAAFKSGERNNPTMAGFSAGLTPEDMANLDAYYSSLTAAQGAISEDQAELAAEGEKIFKGGFAERQIASCMSCHGASGKGVPKHFPSVAGQKQAYLEAQLLSFKKGERKGYNEMMYTIAFALSEQQIKALSVYMSGLN